MSNKYLVLVESPNKKSTIKSYLSNDYRVEASVGHISEIRDGGKYFNTGIDPEKGFCADFARSQDKKEIVARLSKLVQESDIVYVCSDPDREGEAIAWSLKKFLKIPNSKLRRATFQEINKKAVLDALSNYRDIDDNLVDAAHARMKLDKMLGYRMSPIARKSISAKSVGRCQGKTFLLIRESDNKIVGTINVRWNLSEEMLQFGGHIGYGIRPTERRKGYNKINLYLGMIEAKKVGLEKVMLDCDVNNLGSDKTLKALGGKLERTEIDPSDGILTNVYWFDVNETLEKYKEIYEPYISIKEDIKTK